MTKQEQFLWIVQTTILANAINPRNIGKRNVMLNAAAIETAKRIQLQGSKSARWIAADALRELTSVAVQGRVRACGPGSGA